MNTTHYILNNNFLAYSTCFVGGYALNSASFKANQFAVKYLRLPIDILNHQDPEEMTRNVIEVLSEICDLENITLDRQLGATLSDYTIIAIREEFSYRFLLETIILPYISPKFADFSATRICVSSLLFASGHLHKNFSDEALAGTFLNTALLGVICSIAHHRIGLVGSILVHAGFNLYAWQYLYSQKFSDTLTKLKAIKPVDVINPLKVVNVLGFFISDALSPFALCYKGCKRAVNSFVKTQEYKRNASDNRMSS